MATTLPRNREVSEPAGDTFAAADPREAVAVAELRLPCQTGDADLFFSESPTELERAKRLCHDCPVRAACLAGALARGEPWGVWGGEILERGVVVARKRPRGRPPKNTNTEGRDAA